MADQFGTAFEFDPCRLLGFELRHLHAWYIGFKFNFIVDHDAEQRPADGRWDGPDAGR
jgi:hypothetical protein